MLFMELLFLVKVVFQSSTVDLTLKVAFLTVRVTVAMVMPAV